MTIKATELLKLFTKADKLKLSVYVRESKDGDYEINIFKMYANLFNYKVIITQNGESNWNKGDYSFDTMMNVLDEMLKEKEQEKIKEEKRQELIQSLVAYDLAGVQPMNGPTGLIFAMRSRYADQTGTESFSHTRTTKTLGGIMTNPNPECPREDCRFQHSGGMTTLAYYPPMYDKNGVNTNPDRNTTSFTTECLSCGKIWRGKTCLGETTYDEPSQKTPTGSPNNL